MGAVRLHALVLVLSAAAPAEDATLRIVTDPAGAAVSLDGALVGLSPREERLEPGVHTITVERSGVAVTETLSLTPGEQRTVRLRLTALVTRPRPFPVAGAVTFCGGSLALVAGLLLQGPAREAAAQVSLLYARGGGWDAAARQVEAQGLAAQTWSNVLLWGGAGVMLSGVVTAVLELMVKAPPALAVFPVSGGAGLSWGARW
jgi:hypothetical protein